MKDEIFGPVMIVNTFTNEEDVLKRANDSEYGLYASVYTKDLSRALRVAKRLEAGSVAVNCTSPTLAFDMPFGGWKGSGQGREFSRHYGFRLLSLSSEDLSHMMCLCVQFDKASGADESEIAQRTAEWLGVKFMPILIDDIALAERFEDATWYSETVMPDANGPGRMAIAEIAHNEGLKVVLTGEGSDEHFGGYAWLNPEAIREPDHSWPNPDFSKSDRFQAVQTAEARPDLNFGGRVTKRPATTARMLNDTITSTALFTLTLAYFAPWTSYYSDINPKTLMAESFNGSVREFIANKWHPLHTSQYIYTKTAFPNLLLRYVGDNVDMAHGIKSRTLFIDHHLTEYVNNLPPSLKMRYDPISKTFNEKYVLKEAMRHFISDEIYKRKKHSFVGPTRYIENGPFWKLLKKLVTKENIDQLGFLDWDRDRTSGLIDKAFVDRDPAAMRGAMAAAQFVVLGQKFKVKKAIQPTELG